MLDEVNNHLAEKKDSFIPIIQRHESVSAVMDNITRQAKEMNSIVNEISAESANQAYDIDQVTSALDRIAGVVSENSATAEQSAASCQQLATRSRALKEQVKALKA